MRGKKKIVAALPSLDERELTLVWRDVRRAADVVAMGGSERDWNEYREVEYEIEAECERRFGRKPGDYLNREGEAELAAIYKRIFSRRKGGTR